MTVIIEGRTSTYVMTFQSGITLPVGKVQFSNVFIMEVLKETTS